jgi:lysophospholipase L1-like esterase
VFVGDAHIALAGPNGSIIPLFNYPLTFDGETSVTIRPGSPVLSDPVNIAGRGPLPPPGFWQVAVSLYFPQSVTVETMHPLGLQTAYITNGDTTGDTSLNNPEVSQSRYFLSRIEMITGREGIVALGDSITDGAGSTVDANRRWPDDLVNRLFQCSFCPPLKVVANEGISGNGVLNFGFGPSALARFDRDVLSTPGARYLIVLEGINDIGNSDTNTVANDLIAAYRQFIRRGHSSGLYVYGGTLTPIGGSLYDSPDHEAVRQAVNDWIRNSGEFDAAIDFDAAVRNPAAPTQFLPRYDSGDHLHPNDAGYQAMANAIDLRLFGLAHP